MKKFKELIGHVSFTAKERIPLAKKLQTPFVNSALNCYIENI